MQNVHILCSLLFCHLELRPTDHLLVYLAPPTQYRHLLLTFADVFQTAYSVFLY